MIRTIILQLKRGDEGILQLLEVSNDVAFRLSDASKSFDRALLCDIVFKNFTLRSSYWNSLQGPIFDCNLDVLSNNDVVESFLQFPMNLKSDDDKEPNLPKSYISLPTKVIEQAHKATGVFIAASNLVKRLLPGFNNRSLDYDWFLIG